MLTCAIAQLATTQDQPAPGGWGLTVHRTTELHILQQHHARHYPSLPATGLDHAIKPYWPTKSIPYQSPTRSTVYLSPYEHHNHMNHQESQSVRSNSEASASRNYRRAFDGSAHSGPCEGAGSNTGMYRVGRSGYLLHVPTYSTGDARHQEASQYQVSVLRDHTEIGRRQKQRQNKAEKRDIQPSTHKVRGATTQQTEGLKIGDANVPARRSFNRWTSQENEVLMATAGDKPTAADWPGIVEAHAVAFPFARTEKALKKRFYDLRQKLTGTKKAYKANRAGRGHGGRKLIIGNDVTAQAQCQKHGQQVQPPPMYCTAAVFRRLPAYEPYSPLGKEDVQDSSPYQGRPRYASPTGTSRVLNNFPISMPDMLRNAPQAGDSGKLTEI